MWNVHMFIKCLYAQESEKHKIDSGTKLLFTFLSLRFSDMRRERHNLSMLTVCPSSALNSLTQPTRGHPNWSGLTQIKNRLPSSSVESQLTVFFFKSQNPQPITSGHDVIHIPSLIFYLGFLLWHLLLSHPPCICVNTYTQCVHLTNRCTKPKGSQPN